MRSYGDGGSAEEVYQNNIKVINANRQEAIDEYNRMAKPLIWCAGILAVISFALAITSLVLNSLGE